MPMIIEPGDRVELKKQHPCGGSTFRVLRSGMDVLLKCEVCGSLIRMTRRDLEKRTRTILPKETER
ncbi:MAG: DUF951 domain-containing protein [Clostridiales bacterium]|nr:DUF951 domain-containing protein [Clostridiales bacterium]